LSDDFRQRLNRVEALVEALEQCPDRTTREVTRELVRTLLDLHAAGLTRILDTAGRESALVGRLADDDLVCSLLLLHGLHPHPAAERVTRALEENRPYLRSLGGAVDVIKACEESVRLRIRGESPSALRSTVEGIVTHAAPDAALEVEEVTVPARTGQVSLPLVAHVGDRP
jgi:Fe-S cluster biogenesis protein NfuA